MWSASGLVHWQRDVWTALGLGEADEFHFAISQHYVLGFDVQVHYRYTLEVSESVQEAFDDVHYLGRLEFGDCKRF